MLGPFADIMAKAVNTGTISTIVREDLEVMTYNMMWRYGDPQELVLLRMLPRVDAKQIVHEFSRLKRYGLNPHSSGRMSETALPWVNNPQFSRATVNMTVHGSRAQVTGVAALERTINALGLTDPNDIATATCLADLHYRFNRVLYTGDTRNVRAGIAAQEMPGLFQQVEQATDSTAPGATGIDGEYPSNGSHIIDLRGAALDFERITRDVTEVGEQFGHMNTLLLPPAVRHVFERSLDPAQRLAIGNGPNNVMWGQTLLGIRTGQGEVRIHTDNTLTAAHLHGKYISNVALLTPSAPPAPLNVVVNAQADNATGDTVTTRWDAASAGTVYYIVTQMLNDEEGIGFQSANVAVAAGQEVRLIITPSSALVESFRIYRALSASDAPTDCYHIRTIANSGGGAAVTWYDNNHDRPGLGTAVILEMAGPVASAMNEVRSDFFSYASQVAAAKSDYRAAPGVSAAALASLGPAWIDFNLANIGWTTLNKLVATVSALEMRNPWRCKIYKNCDVTA